nr:GntR family transcriptional regulator [Amycolatopsis arida]
MRVRIADALRLQIERGDLRPGDPIPSREELAEQWGVSSGTVRHAIALLRQQGLITGGQGRLATVRKPPKRIVRDSSRHQTEKDLALKSEVERAAVGAAELDSNTPLSELDFHPDYEVVPAGDLAALFDLDESDELLKRTYVTAERGSGCRRSWSVSYMPVALISGNPDLLNVANEPWPGGHVHQLSTVGIEIDTVIDEVTAEMPTTAEAAHWQLDSGVPMVVVRRTSRDTNGRVVEVSDARYPADRTLLRFTTHLERW